MNAAAAKILAWRADPVLFVRDNFKAEPDAWQFDTLMCLPGVAKPNVLEHEKLRDQFKKRISMQACAGPGKSALLAWTGWWMLSCWGGKGSHPKGAAISMNRDNLRDCLWAELARWQSESPFLMDRFEWTKEKIFAKDHPETWFLSARTYNKDADKESQGRVLSGLHSDVIFYLIDESGDTNPMVLKSCEQGMSSCKVGLIMQAGNCTSHEGMLYAAVSDNTGAWDVISITADPADPKRTPRVDPVWAQEQIDKFGRDDPWVMAYILGKFPPTSMSALLSREEVELAMSRHLTPDKYETSQKRTGTDVARFGDDMSIIFPRQGLAAFTPLEFRNARSNELAESIITGRNQWGSELDFIDCTGGYGSGVADAMYARGYSAVEVQFAARATDADSFFNKRAEIWWNMAQWVKRGGALPHIPRLLQELTAVQYGYQNGKMKIEDKDQIKKRLGFSPDYADALACTFAIPDQVASADERLRALLHPGSVKSSGALIPGTGDGYDPMHDA